MMRLTQKILLSLPSVLSMLYTITIWFPTKFEWLYPTMNAYYIINGVIYSLVIIQIIVLIRKLRSFKNVEKSVKTNWTISLIVFHFIAALIFIWWKVNEFEQEND